MEKLISKLEAILFVHGEPVLINKIAKILNEKEADIQKAAELLELNLKKEDGGLILVKSTDSLQLATKPEYSQLLEQIVKEEISEELTPALLETLAIIAYCSPVSKAEIESIRGVNSSLALRRLELRGLVAGKDNYFQPTIDLTKNLGLTDISQLPEFDNYKQLKNNG